jgi:hypothetical protein
MVTVFPWLQQLAFLADMFNKLNEFTLLTFKNLAYYI